MRLRLLSVQELLIWFYFYFLFVFHAQLRHLDLHAPLAFSVLVEFLSHNNARQAWDSTVQKVLTPHIEIQFSVSVPACVRMRVFGAAESRIPSH